MQFYCRGVFQCVTFCAHLTFLMYFPFLFPAPRRQHDQFLTRSA